MYQLTSNNMIVRLSDNAWIPRVEQNRDYQGYLAWIEEGNTPTLPMIVLEDNLIDSTAQALQLLLRLIQPKDEQDVALQQELLNKFEESR